MIPVGVGLTFAFIAMWCAVVIAHAFARASVALHPTSLTEQEMRDVRTEALSRVHDFYRGLLLPALAGAAIVGAILNYAPARLLSVEWWSAPFFALYFAVRYTRIPTPNHYRWRELAFDLVSSAVFAFVMRVTGMFSGSMRIAPRTVFLCIVVVVLTGSASRVMGNQRPRFFLGGVGLAASLFGYTVAALRWPEVVGLAMMLLLMLLLCIYIACNLTEVDGKEHPCGWCR